MADLDERRCAEIAKYGRAYLRPDYRMGSARRAAAARELSELTGSLLDVGCGRGEVLDLAEACGLSPVVGTEVVRSLLVPGRVIYGEAWTVPFASRSFDNVTLFDVLEHLLPEDAEPVCRELARVARRAIVLTVANFSSVCDGVELHVNRRPYADWDADFRRWFVGDVVWRSNDGSISQTWKILLR